MGYFKALDQRIREAEAAVLSELQTAGCKFKCSDVVGSAYINDSAGSDIDILCLVPGADVDNLFFSDWLIGGSLPSDASERGNWGSWKKTLPYIGEVNMIIVSTQEYYDAWLTSAEVCRLLYLRGVAIDKKTRLSIHNIVMDDSTADYEVNPISHYEPTELSPL